MLRFIDRVGVEIEGGWTYTPENFTHDGSVNGSLGRRCGESVSPSYRRISALMAYISSNWPEKVDSTCGFHIHVSLRSMGDYSRLMDREFMVDALRFWEDWGVAERIGLRHRFWGRLRGGNTYCKTDIDSLFPDVQAADSRKSPTRYYFLNYCHSLHRTVELRLLPAWVQSSTAQKSVQAWVDFIEGYLSRAAEPLKIVGEFMERQEGGEPLVVSESVTVGGSINIVDSAHVAEAALRPYIDFCPVKVGDIVIANGTIDGHGFANRRGEVVEALPERHGGAERWKVRVRYYETESERGMSWWGWGPENSALEVVQRGGDF